MAKTDPVNPNVPAATGERPSRGDDRIRALARAVAEIIGVDHRIGTDSGSGYTEDAAGEHKQVKFYGPISTPSNVANKGFLYVKDFSGKLELCFLDEDGDEIQLTSGGVFNPALACGLTGNQTIAGNKTFSGIATLGDGSQMATSAAPTADAKIANKKYVDDQLTTHDSVTAWGPKTLVDSESNTFLKSHAYLAGQNGVVHAFASLNTNHTLIGYTGATSDPAGAGLMVAYTANKAPTSVYQSITMTVVSGRYFEITCTATPTIIWQPMRSTGGSPVDQD
jgi:hypothetical protein